MAKRLMLAFNNPVEGKEDEYNEWYGNGHIQDVVTLAGYRSAQRFELNDKLYADTESLPYRYVTVYEIDDVDAAKDALAEAKAEGEAAIAEGRRPAVPLSHPSLGSTRVAYWATPVTERVLSPNVDDEKR